MGSRLDKVIENGKWLLGNSDVGREQPESEEFGVIPL